MSVLGVVRQMELIASGGHSAHAGVLDMWAKKLRAGYEAETLEMLSALRAAELQMTEHGEAPWALGAVRCAIAKATP